MAKDSAALDLVLVFNGKKVKVSRGQLMCSGCRKASRRLKNNHIYVCVIDIIIACIILRIYHVFAVTYLHINVKFGKG